MTLTPHSPDHWEESETWTVDRLRSFQTQELVRQLGHVWLRSDYYRKRFAEVGWHPGELADASAGDRGLAGLPFTRKYDYVDSLAETPPWGSAIAVEPHEVARIHFSSGTTAKPAPLFWTDQDIETWTQSYARMYYGQGIRPADVAQIMYTFSWFVGGAAALQGLSRVGAATIPAGPRDSERQIDTILRFGTTVLPATPSFVFHLLEVAEKMGVDLADSSVSKIVIGGEPGASVPSTRARIEDGYGAEVFDTYGSLEFQPIAWECVAHDGLHLNELATYVEVVDPVTDEAVPDGEPGVVVLTHLQRQASPLVRWWTGDIAVRENSQCACGRTGSRLVGGVRGRADDMLVVRGVNLFPSAVEQIVRATPGAAGEYLIVLDDSVKDPATGYLTGIKVRFEMERAAELRGEEAASALVGSIHAQLGVRAQVEAVPFATLPRSEHKSKRVVDE